MKYIKISEDYFLNCSFPSRTCHKKAVCLDSKSMFLVVPGLAFDRSEGCAMCAFGLPACKFQVRV